VCSDIKGFSPIYFYSRLRWGAELKKIIPEAIERDFSDILVVNEDQKRPNGLVVIHLPSGPTAHFKLTGFKRGYDIKGHGKVTQHRPEVILNNFTTRLGHSVGRMFASWFPQVPQFTGRRVVTFHNQRDFVFLRHHRYTYILSSITVCWGWC
jgi:ribosome production factor 1